jgi:catechol 2,3-dioxygenase-like lactoylglutathione lyase family enzyme
MSGERVRDLIPFVPVADVKRSIAFYELLGFEVSDTYVHGGELDFAAMHSDAARIMLVRAGGTVEPGRPMLRFYLYVDDLDALRSHLIENGVEAGAIVDGTPGPRRELTLRDPDRYCLMVAEIEVR